MELTPKERGWRDGRAGEATRLALDLVAPMDELFGAERLLPGAQHTSRHASLSGGTIPVETVSAAAYDRIQAGDWLVVDATAGEVRWRAAAPPDSSGPLG